MAWPKIDAKICRSIAEELATPPAGPMTGRPIAKMRVFVSFLKPDKNVGASGAVTCTNFHPGAKLPDMVT